MDIMNIINIISIIIIYVCINRWFSLSLSHTQKKQKKKASDDSAIYNIQIKFYIRQTLHLQYY